MHTIHALSTTGQGVQRRSAFLKKKWYKQHHTMVLPAKAGNSLKMPEKQIIMSMNMSVPSK